MVKGNSFFIFVSQEMGIGAQFGGKYFCHDIRVIRLPRHGKEETLII
jgi:tartrate dehydratase alpha subunit/fumarate hydratase class I-like protein